MDSKKNHSIFKKLKNFLDDDLKKIKKPQVLEFGVREGISCFAVSYFQGSPVRPIKKRSTSSCAG